MVFNFFHVGIALLAILETCSALPLTVPQPGRQCMINYCPTQFSDFPPRGRRTPTTTINLLKTNAERLLERMPLKPPMFRVRNALPWTSAIPGPAPSRPSGSPPFSPPDVKHCGVISLKNKKGTRVGYISKKLSSSGVILANETITNAVTVCFMNRKTQIVASNVTLAFKDWDLGKDFPLLGLMQGENNTDSNIGQGSAEYLDFVGVKRPPTPPGSPPKFVNNTFSDNSGLERDVETSVWTINLGNGKTTAQWMNSNGEHPHTRIFAVDNVLYAGGDPRAFASNSSTVIVPLTLQFIKR